MGFTCQFRGRRMPRKRGTRHPRSAKAFLGTRASSRRQTASGTVQHIIGTHVAAVGGDCGDQVRSCAEDVVNCAGAHTVEVDTLRGRAVDIGPRDGGIGAINVDNRRGGAGAGKCSAVNDVSCVHAQAERIPIINQHFHVAISAYRTIVEGDVLVEVAEAVDARVAGPNTRSRAVVGNDATVEGVVGGIVVAIPSKLFAPFSTVAELSVFHRAAIVLKGRL